MGVIFFFSHQSGNDSSNLSSTFIAKTYEFITNKTPTVEIIDKFSFFTRKLAHFSVYFVLGALIINCLLSFNIKHYVHFSILISFLYALSDEIHQMFVPGRYGAFTDSLIDTSGAICSILLIFLIRYLIIRHRNNKENI